MYCLVDMVMVMNVSLCCVVMCLYMCLLCVVLVMSGILLVSLNKLDLQAEGKHAR